MGWVVGTVTLIATLAAAAFIAWMHIQSDSIGNDAFRCFAVDGKRYDGIGFRNSDPCCGYRLELHLRNCRLALV